MRLKTRDSAVETSVQTADTLHGIFIRPSIRRRGRMKALCPQVATAGWSASSQLNLSFSHIQAIPALRCSSASSSYTITMHGEASPTQCQSVNVGPVRGAVQDDRWCSHAAIQRPSPSLMRPCTDVFSPSAACRCLVMVVDATTMVCIDEGAWSGSTQRLWVFNARPPALHPSVSTLIDTVSRRNISSSAALPSAS